jgi:hypothetical protein
MCLARHQKSSKAPQAFPREARLSDWGTIVSRRQQGSAILRSTGPAFGDKVGAMSLFLPRFTRLPAGTAATAFGPCGEW